MIDHGHRLVFVHVPKCAGMAVEAAMGGLPPEQRPLQHWSAALHARYEPEAWARYARFAIVRDPIARALSFVRFLRRFDPIWRGHLGEVGDEVLLRDLVMSSNLLTRASLTAMLAVDGAIDVEILRFEELAATWPVFAARHDLPEALPRINEAPQATAAGDLSPAMTAMVAAIFADDLDAFGYPRPAVDPSRWTDAELGWVRWAELRAAALRLPEVADSDDADGFRRFLGEWALSLPAAWQETWGEAIVARPPALRGWAFASAWTDAIHDDVRARLGQRPWRPWRP